MTSVLLDAAPHDAVRVARATRLARCNVLARRGVAVAALTLVGCSGDKATGPATPGTAHFTYAGALSGSFDVTGALPNNSVRAEGAAAWHHLASNPASTILFHTLQAMRAAPGGGFDDLSIYLYDIRVPGSFAHCPEQSDPPSGGCILAAGFYDVGGGLGAHFSTDVTVTVTELTASRLRATFAGTFSSGPTTITISGGVLDLPVR